MQLRTVSEGLSTTLVAGRSLTTPHLQEVILRNVTKVLGFGRILWARSHEIRISKIYRYITDVFSLHYICNDQKSEGNGLRFLTVFLTAAFTSVEGTYFRHIGVEGTYFRHIGHVTTMIHLCK
jgi:uncharacterized membrane protein